MAIRLAAVAFYLPPYRICINDVARRAKIGLPSTVDHFVQAEGQDICLGTSVSMPTVSGSGRIPGQLIQSSQHILDAIGRRIDGIVASDLAPATTLCPTLSDRWINSVHWFGRACGSNSDLLSILMLKYALDLLTDGGHSCDPVDLVEQLLSPSCADATTCDIERLYSSLGAIQQRISEGSLLSLRLDGLNELRVRTEGIIRSVVTAFVMILDEYALNGAKDDMTAFVSFVRRRPETS